MSDRRLTVNLTLSECQALVQAAAWVRGIGSMDQGALRSASFELSTVIINHFAPVPMPDPTTTEEATE